MSSDKIQVEISSFPKEMYPYKPYKVYNGNPLNPIDFHELVDNAVTYTSNEYIGKLVNKKKPKGTKSWDIPDIWKGLVANPQNEVSFEYEKASDKFQSSLEDFLEEFQDEKDSSLKALIDDYEISELKIKFNFFEHHTWVYSEGKVIECSMDFELKTEKFRKIIKDKYSGHNDSKRAYDLINNKFIVPYKNYQFGHFDFGGGWREEQYGYRSYNSCHEALDDDGWGVFKKSMLEGMIQRSRKVLDSELETAKSLVR